MDLDQPLLVNFLKELVFKFYTPGAQDEELVHDEPDRVNGISNYHCILISKYLTTHGMDRSGKACPIDTITTSKEFNPKHLQDRAFQIDEKHLEVQNFGRDSSGSATYLSQTLDRISKLNKDESSLVPIHVDGDGHCLLHAVSRALVGRQLFWHPLRCSLEKHFKAHLEQYRALLSCFIEDHDWNEIISECQPDFEPKNGEILGLRNVHILGLANILYRPIILLDSTEGMDCSGDYTGLFLPVLRTEQECRSNDGNFNKPICIAWASSARNHFIPLVGIKGKPLPKLHKTLMPKPWGCPSHLFSSYISYDHEGFCVIGGSRSLGETYILKLVDAMGSLFLDEYFIHPSLVSVLNHSVIKLVAPMTRKLEEVILYAQRIYLKKDIFKCCDCRSLTFSDKLPDPAEFKPGGKFYIKAVGDTGKGLQDRYSYSFPRENLVLMYVQELDELVLNVKLSKQFHCQNKTCSSSNTRRLDGSGKIQYCDGDKLFDRDGYYWKGIFCDNLPTQIPVTLRWNYNTIEETVEFFQNETNTELNSNVYDIASKLVQHHFPGQFGSEVLLKSVVDQLLEKTKPVGPPSVAQPIHASASRATQGNVFAPDKAMKSIIPGFGILHKEELGVSQVERDLKNRIETKAAERQKRSSGDEAVSNKNKEMKLDNDEQTMQHTKELLEKNLRAAHQRVIDSCLMSIKIVSSKGHDECVVLPNNASYQLLMDNLKIRLGVTEDEIERVHYGYPPKLLVFPSTAEERQLCTPLGKGDRVVVDLKVPKQQDVINNNDDDNPLNYDVCRQLLLTTIRNVDQTLPDSYQLICNAMCMLSDAKRVAVYEIAKSLPHLFTEDGIFVRRLRESRTSLNDTTIYTLEIFPDKQFQFNTKTRTLELYESESKVSLGKKSSKNEIVPDKKTSPVGTIKLGPGFMVLPPIVPNQMSDDSASSGDDDIYD